MNISIKKAAERLGLSQQRITAACRAGLFKTAKKKWGTRWVVDEAEIIDIEEGRTTISFAGIYRGHHE